jgi:hypothetical protein
MWICIRFLCIVLIVSVFTGCKGRSPSVKKVSNPYNITQSQKFVALSNYLAESALKQSSHKDDNKILVSSMQKAFSAVYGKPYLDKGLRYDAQNELFYGYIKSTKGGFSERVSVKVPINEAKNFQRDISKLNVNVWFNYDDNTVTLSRVEIKRGKKQYPSILSASTFKTEDIISTDNLVLTAVNSKNSEIAALQKRKIELEKKAKNKKQTLQKEKQLQAQKRALEAQIAMLEKQNGGYDDIGKFLKKAKSHKEDKTKWLFIVAVEKYEYTDPVAYSENSAKNFKKVMKKRFGIPERNIRTLINLGATSAKINYRLKEMLRRVKEGDTIYFYYSGHGIPVPAKNNAPYMLAQDMNPAYIDDDRFKLENIYRQLSNSKASKIIAFVDSCFSGGADNKQLIKGVAATRVKPKQVTFDRTKMVVISAGSGTQYSNKYDEKSNRLFSYYLMRGLIKNNTDTSRLYDFVKSNVAEKSYEMGESYEQIPVYDGNIKMKL